MIEPLEAMHTVYKYELHPDRLKIEMPKGAKILTAREQHDTICVWAEVDTENATEVRTFEVFGTGHAIPYDMGVSREYISTVMLMGGSLVMHVYEYTGF